MKKHQDSLALRASVLAVRGALITLALVPAAYAADAADLTKATSQVEMGLTNVDKSSYKFGEYNGLQDKGVTVDAGFSLRGGSAYDSNGTTRFGITGSHLGTDNRNLSAEFGEQGRFQINFGYDQLRHNTSDSYQSPYLGLGSNNLSLPNTWATPIQQNVNPNATVPVVPSAANARLLDPNFISNDSVYRFNNAANAANALPGGVSAPYAPTAAQLATMQAVGAADRALFNSYDIYTTRKKLDAGFGFTVNTEWNIKANARHETRDGTQLRAALSRNTGGDVAMIMPVVIDHTTDQYDLSANFKNDKSHLTLAYYGSLFKDGNNNMTWQAWQDGAVVPSALQFGPLATNSISTGAPSNQFHQFSATGGYDLSKTTKLAMNASYSRNTQDEAYSYLKGLGNEVSPVLTIPSSLNGLVITKTLNLKLTAKPVKDLGLTASYKYNDRDNRTAVNTYGFVDAGEGNPAAISIWAGKGALPANMNAVNNITANRPYSKKTQDLNLDADYNLGKGMAVKAGYDWQQIDRGCSGTWIQCSDAPKSTENRLRAEWRAAYTEDLNAKIGYARSERKVNYNENAWLASMPMAQYISSTAAAAGVTQSAYQAMLATGLTGWGPNAGFPLLAGVAMTTAQQQAAFGVNQAYYWLNNNAMSSALYGNQNVIYDPTGFRRYFAANRNEDRLRSKLDWQLNEKVGLGAGLDYTNDKYPDSVYGLQNEKATNLNLEASFKPSDDLTANVFYSYEDRRQSNRSNARGSNSTTANVNTFTAITDPYGCTNAAGALTNTIALRNIDQKVNSCGNWTSDRTDKTDTWGLGFKQKNLAGGKFDLMGDVIWARSHSDNNFTSGTWSNNPAAVAGAPAGTVAAFFIPAQALPTYTTDTVTLKMTGHYRLDKTSAVRVGYSYNHMKVVDWQMADMSIGGGLTGVLPSNETAPNYTVQSVSAVYIYSFK